METITYETAQQLLKEANDQIMESFPNIANVRAVEIVDSGFNGFNPTISWLGACSNSPKTAVTFAAAVLIAANLIDEMPHKGAKVTF